MLLAVHSMTISLVVNGDSCYQWAMKDIRPELQEFLAQCDDEAAAVTQRYESEIAELREKEDAELSVIADRQEHLRALIADLDGKFGVPLPEVPKREIPEQHITEFIEDLLRKNGPMRKEELRDKAVGAHYFGPDEVPGRSIHFTVINMVRGKRIVEREDGRFELAQKEETPPVFFGGAS